MNEDYRPKISFEVRPDQIIRMQQILPFGAQKPLFQALVDGIIAAYDKAGYDVIGAIISGHITVTQLAEIGKPYTHSMHKGGS